jgi:arginase
MRDIAIIGVPIDLGAGRRGVDMGPSAIRYAGLKNRLAQIGYHVRDLGNLSVPLAEQIDPPPTNERLRYLAPIAAVNRELAQRVAAAVTEGAFPLILGGDHSLAIGSITGAARGRRIGAIWIDAHADFNTPETTPSGNIHGMSLAALVGRGSPALAGGGPLRPEDVALVGVRDIDRLERDTLRQSGVHIFTMHDIDRRGMAAVMDEALARVNASTAGFHVSFDLDALDPTEAPGVGTPVSGGLSAREAHLALELVAGTARMLSLDLVEVNPILDNRNATAEHAVELALSALGKSIL